MNVKEENNQEKISRKVIEKIKKEKIEMKPSIYFKLIAGACFFSALLFFILAAFLFSFSIYSFFQFESISILSRMIDSFVFYFSIVPFLVGIGLLYLSARFYRKGRIKCCHEDWALFSFLALGGIVMAIFFVKFELVKEANRAMEAASGNKITKKIYVSQREFWSNPQKGTLSGVIYLYDSKKRKEMNLVDWEEKNWIVDVENSIWHLRADQKIKGQKIKMIGLQKGEFFFEAWEIWPWNMD